MLASPSSPHDSLSAIGPGLPLLITRHIDHIFRALLRGSHATIDPHYTRLLTGEPHPFANFVLFSDPLGSVNISGAVQPLIDRNAPAAVLFTGDVPNSAAATLKAGGFERHDGLPAMAVEIDKLAAAPLPAGCAFTEFTSPVQRDTWADTFARGYELPRIVGDMFASGCGGNGSIRYNAILRDGKPVCTSMLYLHDGVAGIYGVATLPHERGKGLGAYATAEALRVAQKLGYRVGVLQASAAGHSVYRRLGFADFGEVALYVRLPS